MRAYRNAARTIGTLGTPVETILKNNGHALEELPGIGADLAGKITRMCRTGELPLLLKINEYGVFRGKRKIGGRTEAEVFEAVGLPWIPPERRENRGEIEAARAGCLPRLVEVTDIRGDLQMHTDATNGKNTLAEMVAACETRGYATLWAVFATPELSRPACCLAEPLR